MAFGDFTAAINRNIQRVQNEVNAKCYKISIELFLKVVSLTPSPSHPGHTAVGLLANQWYPETGGGFSSALGTSISPNGADSRNRILALRGGTEFLSKNGRLTLTNNVHYAFRAEYRGWPKEDGWSGNVGPYRMVALSLQAIAARYPK